MKEKILKRLPNLIFSLSKKVNYFAIIFLMFGGILVAQNSNANENATVYGGDLTFSNGETYTSLCVGDGEADYVSVNLQNESGRLKQWIITDEDGFIVGLPDDIEAVDFDGGGVGICYIYHISYNGMKPLVDPSGQGKFKLHIDELIEKGNGKGRSDLSNPIMVERFQQPTPGVLEGGPFEFCVGDGEEDNIPEGAITLSGNSSTNEVWVVTDSEGNILGLPITYSDVNFDEAPAGVCLVWHLGYEDNVSLDVGNAADLTGCFELSNPITVNRYQQPTPGILEGGPFEFCVGDGEADYIPEGAITLSGNSSTNEAWVVTDVDGNILGLPSKPYDVNFDEAPAGVCLVWHLGYEDNVSFEGVTNAGDLMGCFELSNPITVNRYQQPTPGVLEGGPFEFCVGDGVADNITEGAITLSGNSGTNSTWVVTDADANILALAESPYTVDFDGAPAGLCLVWHLSYEDNVSFEGVTNAADLMGCYALSNAITVNRTEINGGTITGGTENSFSFTVGDGTEDKIPADAITLTGNVGKNSAWVVTNADGTIILGLPANYSDVNFDGAEAGNCLVWHLSYEDGLQGLTPPDEGDHLVSGLSGACFDLSNAITVVRTAATSSKIAVYPNPSKNNVTVELVNFSADNINISIYDLRNSIIYNEDVTFRSLSKKHSLNISDYNSGLYFVKVINLDSGETAIKRLVID